jgi:glycosyltransferase involved in cell wall biosynthesis
MTIRRIHIVYPHGDRASTPDAIGHELGRHLGRRFEVSFHDWAAFERITPAEDAAIVGHAHPVPGTTFRRSVRQPGWGRRVLLQPFVTNLDKVGYLAGVIPHVERFVAITGRYWERRLPSAYLSGIAATFIQRDLAIDCSDFPQLVDAGGSRGRRRLLYIGRDVPLKNLGYLEQIAALRPEWEFARIGPPGPERPGITYLGSHDFRSAESRDLLASFDIAITVGRADANPTTVLEAMAWGLVPVCTPESGYEGYPGVTNIPLGDAHAAVVVLDSLQAMSDTEVQTLRQANRRRVETEYTWDRFAEVVEDAILEPGTPIPLPRSVRMSSSARWWLTSMAPSNRAGLTDAAHNLRQAIRR